MSDLQRTLEQLALLATIRGDTSEASRLTRAMTLVRERGLTSDAALEALFDRAHDGPDADVVKLLRQMHEAGGWVLLESSIADLPNDLRWLYESQAVSLEQMADIHRALGITSAADIAAAVEEGSMADIGVDDRTLRAIADAVPALRATTRRIPLGRAVAIAEPFLTRLESMPSVDWAVPSGSLRRGEETVGDIEIVASSTDPAAAIDAVLADPEVVRSLHRSARRVYALLGRVQLGILFPAPDEAAAALVYRTGSTHHVAALRARAATEALTLTSTGLFAGDGARVAIPTEEALYDRLGLPFIPPEIRTGADEFAAAERRSIPRLVSRHDIRGDLHMHSTWSDGRDSIEAMVEQCRILGYEYVAITDHSPSSAASRNLSVDDVASQAEEIAQLRERFPTVAILHGCEVDILVDGRLDFPDRVLERFDIVLASLHERAGHSRDQLLRRYREATRHPLVTAITHPTNRMVPHRDGYDLDYDRLFEFAAETGTVLEVDGAPAHLDLDGALTRRAVAAGVTLMIDSDCHRSDALERQMYLGLLTARRGWAEPRHVLNTRPLADVRAFIAAKRGTR